MPGRKADLLFNLCFLEVTGSLSFGTGTYLDVVDHLESASRARHTSSRPFMLDDTGGPFPGDDTVLDMEAEAVLADFGFRQFGADSGFDLGIADCAGFNGCRAGAPGADGPSGEPEHHGQ